MNGASYTYDAAGDVTWDGINNYLYDAEGRLCAVECDRVCRAVGSVGGKAGTSASANPGSRHRGPGAPIIGYGIRVPRAGPLPHNTMRKFTFEFEEEAPGKLTFQLSMDENERLETRIEGGSAIVYLNRPAMLTLAKILVKIALGSYREQFHVHLKKNFCEDPDALTIMLYPDDAPSGTLPP
jgi:hypothetical protein